MTKSERAAYVGKKLAELYPETPIPLDHPTGIEAAVDGPVTLASR